MGIRFFCPNGHRLNVKSELAGKVGICPKCKARMLIPFESTRQSGEKSPQILSNDFLISNQNIPEEFSFAEMEPFKSASQETPPCTGNFSQTLSPASNSSSDLSFDSPKSDPALKLSALMAANRAEQLGSASSYENSLDADADSSDDPFLNASHADSPANSEEPVNELLKDPNVIWYVRTLDEQTYGPVTGQVLEAWIQEKRVAPQMLVWKEGWSAWLEAQNAFPELEHIFSQFENTLDTENSNEPDNIEIVTVSKKEKAELENLSSVSVSSENLSMVRRRKKASHDFYIIVGLIIAIAALIVILSIVLFKQNPAAEKTPQETPPPQTLQTSDFQSQDFLARKF